MLFLGIRSGGYSLFSCSRPRVPGPQPPSCAGCDPEAKNWTSCKAGAMAPFADPNGVYGNVLSLHCNTGDCKGGAGAGAGDEFIEAETHDRQSIDLPATQHELAAAVIALGKPTVIVLLNGAPPGHPKSTCHPLETAHVNPPFHASL